MIPLTHIGCSHFQLQYSPTATSKRTPQKWQTSQCTWIATAVCIRRMHLTYLVFASRPYFHQMRDNKFSAHSARNLFKMAIGSEKTYLIYYVREFSDWLRSGIDFHIWKRYHEIHSLLSAVSGLLKIVWNCNIAKL